MSEHHSSGRTDPNVIATELAKMGADIKAEILGKSTTETHKSTVIIETKTEGSGKAEKDLQKVAEASNAVATAAQSAADHLKELETAKKTISKFAISRGKVSDDFMRGLEMFTNKSNIIDNMKDEYLNYIKYSALLKERTVEFKGKQQILKPGQYINDKGTEIKKEPIADIKEWQGEFADKIREYYKTLQVLSGSKFPDEELAKLEQEMPGISEIVQKNTRSASSFMKYIKELFTAFGTIVSQEGASGLNKEIQTITQRKFNISPPSQEELLALLGKTVSTAQPSQSVQTAADVLPEAVNELQENGVTIPVKVEPTEQAVEYFEKLNQNEVEKTLKTQKESWSPKEFSSDFEAKLQQYQTEIASLSPVKQIDRYTELIEEQKALQHAELKNIVKTYNDSKGEKSVQSLSDAYYQYNLLINDLQVKKREAVNLAEELSNLRISTSDIGAKNTFLSNIMTSSKTEGHWKEESLYKGYGFETQDTLQQNLDEYKNAYARFIEDMQKQKPTLEQLIEQYNNVLMQKGNKNPFTDSEFLQSAQNYRYFEEAETIFKRQIAELEKLAMERKKLEETFQPLSYGGTEEFLRNSEYWSSAHLSTLDIQSKFGVDDKIVDSETASLEQYQKELDKYNDILKAVSSRRAEIVTAIQSLYNENFGNLSQVEAFPKLAKEWDETDDITRYFERRIDILRDSIEQYQEKVQEFQEITKRSEIKSILHQQESYKTTDIASSDIKDIFGLNTDFSTPMEQLKAYEKAQDDLIEKRSVIFDKARELYNSSKGNVQNNTEFQDFAIDLKHLDQAREYFDQIIPDIQKSVEEYKKAQEELAKPVQSGANGSGGSNGSGLPISPEQIQAITDGINNLVEAFKALNKAIGQIDEKNPNTIIESLSKFTTHNNIDFKFMIVQTQHLKSIIDEFQELNKSFGSTDEKKGIGTLLTQLHDLTKVIDEMDFGKLDNLKIQLQNVFSLDGGIKSQKMQITSALLEVKKLIEDLALFKVDQGLNISKYVSSNFDYEYAILTEERRKKGNIGAETDLVYQQNIFNSLIEILKKAGVEVNDFEKRYSDVMNKLQSSTSNSLPQGIQEILNPGQQSINNINIINTSLDELIQRLETIGNLMSSSMGLGTIFTKNEKNESIINPIDFSKIGLNTKSQATTDVNTEVSGFQSLVDILRSTVRLIENKNQQLERELRIVQDNIPQESQLFSDLNTSLSTVRGTLSEINTELSKIDFSKFKLPDDEIGTKLTTVATQLQTIANTIPNISFDKFNPASNASLMASDLEKINKDLQGIVTALGQIDFTKFGNLPNLPSSSFVQNPIFGNGNPPSSQPTGGSGQPGNNPSAQPQVPVNPTPTTPSGQPITPNNPAPLPTPVQTVPERIIRQTGPAWEEGSFFTLKTGVATTQRGSYYIDDNGFPQQSWDKENTSFETLLNAAKKADDKVIEIQHNIDIVKSKYKTIDISDWQKDLEVAKQKQAEINAEVEKYHKNDDYRINYSKFSADRQANVEATTRKLNEKDLIDAEKVQRKVESERAKLNSQMASINSSLRNTPEYQSILSQISGAKTLGDIENVNKAYKNFLATVNSVRDQLKNVSGSLDPWQNAINMRDNKGQVVINDYITKFRDLGLSAEQAKEKVKPLQEALNNWKVIDINSQNGITDFGTAGGKFNLEKFKTEAALRNVRNQNKIDKQTKAQEKRAANEDYNITIAAIRQVIKAQNDLNALYKERNTNPIFGKDYVAEIEAAKTALEGYKKDLQDIFAILDAGNNQRGLFTTNSYISPNKNLTYQKAYDQMTKSEETFNANRINDVKNAYAAYTNELRKYVEMLSDNTTGQYNAQLEEQKNKVDELRQKYVELKKEAKEYVPISDIKGQLKDQFSEVNKLIDTNGMKEILAKYQKDFITSKDILTSEGLNLNLGDSISVAEDGLNKLKADLESTNMSWETFVDRLNKISPDLQGLNVASDQIKGFSEQFKTYGQEIATHTDTWKQKIEEVKLAMQAMFDARDTDGFQTKVQELLRLLGELDKYRAATESKNAKGAIVSEGDVKSVNDLTQKMGEFAQQAKLGTEISRQVNESTGEATIRYRSLSGSITEVKGHIEQLTGAWRMQMNSISSSNTFITGFTSSLKGMFQGLTRFASATMLASKFRSEITKGLSTFKEYNSTLTNISYTMNLTSKELDTLGKSAIDMAKDLSMSISNAESVYKIYANMNTSIEEIQRMAKPTVILSNLSGVDASTAADEVQGIIQQFNMLKESEDDVADVSMHVVDVLDNISANIAMDYSKGISVITQAVTATGQVAHDAGMSFEQLAAISAKVAERTREDGSTIGNAMKTIITRISKVGKMPQYAEEVDNDVLSKASESLNSIGIQVYQSNGEMNDMITILSQLREKWDSLTDAQQANISFNIAATRQTSKFKNILEAWTDSMALADQATQAQGNALENQEKYEESVAGKMQQLRTQMDSFWVEFYNSDITKGIIDFLINLAKAFNDLSKAIGPLGALSTFLFGGAALRGGITGLFSFIKGANFLKFNKTLQLLSAGKLVRNLNAAGHDLPIIQQVMQNMYGAKLGEQFNTMTVAQMKATTGWVAFLKTIAPTAAILAGVAVAIIGTKYAIDTFSQSTDKLIERNNKLVTAQQKVADEHKSVISENNRNAESLQKLLTQYEAAEVGSEEYYNVRAQIADQFEDLIVGYDDEGRAIIANTETIRNLIQAYHDLSFAEAEAMRKDAAQNLNDSILGNNDGILGNGGNGAKQLIEKRKKLLESIATADSRYDEIKNKVNYYSENRPNWTTNLLPEDERIIYEKGPEGLRKEYNEQIKQLDDQLINLRSHWKQQYGLLAGDLTGLTTEQTDALNALEELSVRYGEVSNDFANMWTNLKYSDPERQKGFAETINALLYPDLSNISVDKDSYKDYVNKYLGDLVKYMGDYMDQEEYNELVYELKIDTTQDTFNQQIEDILNNADYQAMADKLEINLEDTLKKKNLSDIQLFNANNFFSDEAKTQIEQQFGEEIKKLKELTNVGLMDVDWAKASSYSAEEYLNAFNEAISRGINTSQTQFGNIDLTNRQKLYNPDGSISTVLGTSSEYNGIEIAYSPILQTENGPKELSKDVIDKYIGGLFEQLPEKWHDEDLLELDATGLEIDGLKIKNLIADIGDTARDTAENMHLIEEIRLNDIALNRGTLTDSESVAKDVAQSLIGKGVAKDIQSAIDLMERWQWITDATAEAVTKDFDTFKGDTTESLKKAGESLTALNSAMSEMNKNGYVTKDTYAELTEANNAYSEALIMTTKGLTLDRKKVKQLRKDEVQLIRTKINDKYEELRNTYKANIEEVAKLEDELRNMENAEKADRAEKEAKIQALNKANLAIQGNISSLQQLRGELASTTGYYAEWQAAISNGSHGDQYNTVQGWFETYKELAEKGFFGNESFEAFTSMFTGIDNFSLSEAGKYYDMIAKFGKKYFTEDDTGALNFAKEIRSALENASKENPDFIDWLVGDEDFQIKNMEELAIIMTEHFRNKFGEGWEDFVMTNDLMEVMSGMLTETGIWDYGDGAATQTEEDLMASITRMEEAKAQLKEDGKKGSILWQMYDQAIQNANQSLFELQVTAAKFTDKDQLDSYVTDIVDTLNKETSNKDHELEIPLVFTSKNEAESTLQQLLQMRKELEASGQGDEENATTGLTRLEEINALISFVLGQKQEFEKPWILTVDTSQFEDEKFGEFVTKLEEYHEAHDRLEQALLKDPTSETSQQALEEVQKYRKELQELDEASGKEYSIKLGIDLADDQDLDTQIQNLPFFEEKNENGDYTFTVGIDGVQDSVDALQPLIDRITEIKKDASSITIKINPGLFDGFVLASYIKSLQSIQNEGNIPIKISVLDSEGKEIGSLSVIDNIKELQGKTAEENTVYILFDDKGTAKTVISDPVAAANALSAGGVVMSFTTGDDVSGYNTLTLAKQAVDYLNQTPGTANVSVNSKDKEDIANAASNSTTLKENLEGLKDTNPTVDMTNVNDKIDETQEKASGLKKFLDGLFGEGLSETESEEMQEKQRQLYGTEEDFNAAGFDVPAINEVQEQSEEVNEAAEVYAKQLEDEAEAMRILEKKAAEQRQNYEDAEKLYTEEWTLAEETASTTLPSHLINYPFPNTLIATETYKNDVDTIVQRLHEKVGNDQEKLFQLDELIALYYENEQDYEQGITEYEEYQATLNELNAEIQELINSTNTETPVSPEAETPSTVTQEAAEQEMRNAEEATKATNEANAALDAEITAQEEMREKQRQLFGTEEDFSAGGFDVPTINEPQTGSFSYTEDIHESPGPVTVDVPVTANPEVQNNVADEINEVIEEETPEETEPTEIDQTVVVNTDIQTSSGSNEITVDTSSSSIPEIDTSAIQSTIAKYEEENVELEAKIEELQNTSFRLAFSGNEEDKKKLEEVDTELTEKQEKLKENLSKIKDLQRQLEEVNTQLSEESTASEISGTFNEATASAEGLTEAVQTASQQDTGDLGTPGSIAGMVALTDATNTVGGTVQTVSTYDITDLGAVYAKTQVDNLNQSLRNTATEITNIPSEKTVTINMVQNGKVEGTTATASGTAKWSFGRALVQGDIGALRTEEALVGELGPEMRVRGSKWELLGQNGPEFRDVRKGDIIFNADQTADLLSSGKTTTRGKAFVRGTSGTAYLDNQTPTSDLAGRKKITKNVSVYHGKSDSDDSVEKAANTVSDAASSASEETKSALDDIKDAWGRVIDWIQVKIENIEKQIEHATNAAERTYVSRAVREADYAKAIRNLKQESEILKKASKGYNDYGEKILKEGLSELGYSFKSGTIQAYGEAISDAVKAGVDLTRTQYGNIDLNNRQKLKVKGGTATVLGSSAEYDGVEIAYSPIQQTKNGAKLLSQKEVDEYIFSLIDRLGEGWKNKDLLKLDSVKNGGKGLIADIGETARAIGENMHLAEAVKFAKAKVPTGSNEEKEVLEAVMTKMAGGAIDITRYSEDAKTIIDEWMKWYDQKEAADEKALEIEQQRVDLVKERAELYLTENETMSSHIDARNERIQSRIDSGTKYNTNTTIARYGRISGNTEDQIKLAEDRLKYLKDIQKQFEKGTEDWWEYQTQIDETTNNIDQLTDSIEKNNQAIVDLRIERLNDRKDQIEYASSRIQSQIDNGYTLNQKGMMKGYKRINKNNTSQIGILSQELDILREAQSKVTKDSAKWWDYQKQINDVTTSIDDLTDSIRSNQKAMVDLQIEYQNNEIDKFQAEMDRVQTGMDMREAFNVSASAEQYQQLNAHITQQISLSQKQIGIIKQAQQSVKKGSTEWWNYQKSLDDTKNSTLELTQAIISNAQAMAELPMQEAERKNEKIENANSIIQSQMESVNETNAKKRNAYIRQEISNNGLKLGNTQVAYNQTKGNAKTARTSLGKTFDKSFDKANEEHEELLKRMMDSADGKNIISVDDIYKLARIIATNPTDAKALNAFYNSAIQYNAMIQAKDTAQNAYKLAKASQKAEAEASAQAMLANRQTARDKKIEKANAKFDIASSIFDNSVGRNFAYSQTKRDAETRKLNQENKYYNQELAGVNADLTATSTDIRSLVTTEKKANKNNAKYLAALKRIQSAVKAKKKIESSDISLVQGSNTELAGLLYAYNAQLDQAVIAREEQASAYATNSARKAEIENEATEKRKTIADNQIGRNDARAANALSASARNKLVANDNKQLRKKDEANAARTANFLNESDTQKTIFNQLGKKAVKQKGMPQLYASTIKHAMSVANQGKSIGSGDIERIYEGYVNGYISYDLYMACIDYNNAHEWYREAKYTEELELASNTTERAANRVAMIQNILTEGDNKRALRTYGSVGDKMGSTRNGTNKTQFNRDYAQEAGHYTNPQDINDDIFNAKVDLDQYQKDYKAAVKSYTQAIKKGEIQEGTDQWYEAQAAIETARQGIDNSKLAIKQLKNEMRDLEWTKFDDMMASVKRLNSEMSHFQTMIGNEMMFDEFNKGNITRYGMASATLHNEAYQANLQEAIMYKDELNKIQQQIRKGQLDATDKAVIDRQNELVDAIRETTEAAESEKQAMIDLVRQGYEAQLSYLNKTISKYKELKQSEKEAYDYHREISDSVENITNIQRQLAAFEGNSSEESVATVQRLQVELKKAQDDLRDRQYNKYLSDAQNMLDDLSNDFQEWIEFYMRDRDQVLIDIKEEISGVSHDLGGTLTSSDKIAARAIDTLKLSEEKLFEDQSKTVSTLGSNLKSSVKDTSDTLEKPITDMATKYQKSIDDQQIKEEKEQKAMESQSKVAADQYKKEQEEIKTRHTEVINKLTEVETDLTTNIHGVIDDFTNSDSTLTADKATDALDSVKKALGIDIGDAAKTISDAITLKKENEILEIEDKKAQEKQVKQDQKTLEQLTKDQMQANQEAFESAVKEIKKKEAAETQEKAMNAIEYSGFKNALDVVKESTGSASSKKTSSKKKVTKKTTTTKTDSNDNLLIAGAASDPEPVTKSKKKKSTTKTKPVVGDKVTFDSGVYHESSDGTGSTGSAYLGKSVYIVNVNNSDWAKYPYLISPTSSYDDGVGWVSLKQLKGYFKGGSVGSSQSGWTQEKGSEVIYRKSDGAMLTPLGAGDMVFTHAMSENLWNLAKMDIPSMIERSMSQPIVTNKQDISVSPNTSVQMNITLPNVKNYDEFKQAMLNDSQFQNSIQAMTLGAAMGQNSLSKYKYK